MRRSVSSAAAALFASCISAAEPSLVEGSVGLSQDPRSGNLVVRYELAGAPAIITVDFVDAEGRSIGAERFADVTGDVNRKISPGEREITWRPSGAGEEFAPGDLKAEVSVWATNSPPDYMVADLSVTNVVRFYATTNAFPGGFGSDRYKTRELVMRRIPAAGVTWRQGMPSTQVRRLGNCTNRYVTLSSDYYIGVYEYTVGQNSWVANADTGIPTTADRTPAGTLSTVRLRGAVEADGSEYGRYNWPADGHNVSPGSIIGKIRGITGLPFDLPTEAQWEYACRAGSPHVTHFGAFDDSWAIGINGNPYEWTSVNSAVNGENVKHEVGLLRPNVWMLYDMQGNLSERCLDWYGEDRSAGSVSDPKGPFSNSLNRRVIKGGNYNDTWTSAQCGGNVGFAADSAYGTMGARFCCPMCEW